MTYEQQIEFLQNAARMLEKEADSWGLDFVSIVIMMAQNGHLNTECDAALLAKVR